MMRRSPIILSLATTALVAAMVSGCGSSGSNSGGGSGGSGGTVHLGLVVPLTGTLSQAGQDMQNGAKVAAAEINKAGGINGKQLVLDISDDGSDPTKTAQATRDLIAGGHKLVLGGLSSTECSAINSLVPHSGAVYIATTCVDGTLTGTPGKKGTANVFRTGLSNNAALPQVKDQPKIVSNAVPGITTWDYFGYDYSFGHQQETNFANSLKATVPGASVGSTVFAPLTSQNFRPYVSQLATGVNSGSSGRALFLGTYGAGSVSFFQQADSFNFLPKYKLIFTTGDPWDVLLSLKGSFPSMWTWYDYVWSAYDNPTNTAFVKDFRSANNRLPGGWAAEAFNGVQAYAAAIKKAGTDDPAKVSAALAGVSYPSTQGTQTIDATTHQADTNIVMSNVQGDPASPDGVKTLRNVLVHPDGSQSDGAVVQTAP
jgi:branched-chain amino acid transport system substrate-binding protein